MNSWLAILDFPDERATGLVRIYSHMHIEAKDEADAERIAQMAADLFGVSHKIIPPGAVCPQCLAKPPRVQEWVNGSGS